MSTLTSLAIEQDNIVDGCNVLAVHSPLNFIIIGTNSAGNAMPEFIGVKVYNDSAVLLGEYKARRLNDYDGIAPAKHRRYIFKAERVLRSLMGSINDEAQTDSLIRLADIEKGFEIEFYSDALSDSVEVIGYHAARQVGETEAMVEICSNQDDKVFVFNNKEYYLYFYTNHAGVTKKYRLGSTVSLATLPSGNITGYWNFNEASGNAIDSSGNNNTGVLTGGVTRVAGVSGNALSFNGTDGFVSVGNKVIPDASPEYTTSYFMKAVGTGTVTPVVIRTIGTLAIYQLYRTADKRISIFVETTGGLFEILTPENSVLFNEWYHIAVTFKQNSHLRIYVNGIIAAENTTDAVLAFPTTATTGLFLAVQTGGADYFNGTLDEVLIYNRALSEQEIFSIASLAPIVSTISGETVQRAKLTGGVVGVQIKQVADVYTDWYLGSRGDMELMRDNLHLEGVGDFVASGAYWTSSQSTANNASQTTFESGAARTTRLKNEVIYVRPVRDFTSTNVYDLKEFAGGGYVFRIVDLGGGTFRYYVAAPKAFEVERTWGTVGVDIAGTSNVTGTGAANTALIVAVESGKAANYCDELDVVNPITLKSYTIQTLPNCPSGLFVKFLDSETGYYKHWLFNMFYSSDDDHQNIGDVVNVAENLLSSPFMTIGKRTKKRIIAVAQDIDTDKLNYIKGLWNSPRVYLETPLGWRLVKVADGSNPTRWGKANSGTISVTFDLGELNTISML